MAWTQGQLDALETAIAQGARSVEYDGRSVQFRSLEEMFQLRDKMKAEIAGTAGASATARHLSLARHDKGL